MKKKLLALLAGLALALTGIGIFGGTASAGTYWTTTNCAHGSYTKWICYDVSAGVTEINTNGTKTYLTSGNTGLGSITKGYIAYDVYECNAGADNSTTFNTSGLYGFPTTVAWVDGNFPARNGNINVSTADMNVIAWYANLQQGYPCFVVP